MTSILEHKDPCFTSSGDKGSTSFTDGGSTLMGFDKNLSCSRIGLALDGIRPFVQQELRGPFGAADCREPSKYRGFNRDRVIPPLSDHSGIPPRSEPANEHFVPGTVATTSLRQGYSGFVRRLYQRFSREFRRDAAL